ncbi:MAG TPA: AI-2E family transporter, partial [Polyangiaceae bacterium]|nr:AI-2E family transporter [Polyangiaceae bacterium]
MDAGDVTPPPSMRSSLPPVISMVSPAMRRILAFVFFAGIFALAYVLRGVLVPLFFAFLLAYALDPFVDWLADRKVPRALAAILVMLGIAGLLTVILIFAIPLFIDELQRAAADLPMQLKGLEA